MALHRARVKSRTWAAPTAVPKDQRAADDLNRQFWATGVSGTPRAVYCATLLGREDEEKRPPWLRDDQTTFFCHGLLGQLSDSWARGVAAI